MVFTIKSVGVHLAGCDTVLDDIVQEEQAGLVTVNQHPFALVVLASHTYAVGIRVACHHDVASIFLASSIAMESASAFSGFGETTVGKSPLFTICSGTQCTFSKPHSFREAGMSVLPRVKRSVNDAEVFLTLDYFRVDRKGMNLSRIYLVYIFTDNLNQIFVALELDVLNGNLVYFIDNGCVVRSKYCAPSSQ